MLARAVAVALPLIVVCSALALPACGRKTPVRPPELVAPERIDNLTASNASDGIQLSWRRPTKYADGSHMTDLGGFRVERATPGIPFAPVATIEIADRDRIRQEQRFRWVDPDTQVGETYEYRVIAFTTDAYVSQPSNVSAIERAIPTPAPAHTPTAGR